MAVPGGESQLVVTSALNSISSWARRGQRRWACYKLNTVVHAELRAYDHHDIDTNHSMRVDALEM